MKFADEMALMFLMKSILLTDWITAEEKKTASSQCTGFKCIDKTGLTKHVFVLLFLLICHILHWPCL